MYIIPDNKYCFASQWNMARIPKPYTLIFYGVFSDALNQYTFQLDSLIYVWEATPKFRNYMTKQHELQKWWMVNVWSIFGCVRCIQNRNSRMERNVYMLNPRIHNKYLMFYYKIIRKIRFTYYILHKLHTYCNLYFTDGRVMEKIKEYERHIAY